MPKKLFVDMSTKKRLLRTISFKANFRGMNTSSKLFSVCLVCVDCVNVSSSNRFWLVYHNYISSPTVSSTVIKVEPYRTDQILVTDVFCHQHRLLQIYFLNITTDAEVRHSELLLSYIDGPLHSRNHSLRISSFVQLEFRDC